MFQNTRNWLTIRCCRRFFLGLALLLFNGLNLRAEEPEAYEPYFNPKAGFSPAQPNLSKVFLQLAGSLECFGSPEQYIRHVMAEHARIDAKQKAKGNTGSSRPAYLTDAYVDNLIANWNKISPPLKLEAFCRDAGRNIRYAILGSRNMAMQELVSLETDLNEAEQKAYRHLLAKPYFSKADFPSMEGFYSNTFDKLTETGKDQISRRTWLGTLPPEERTKELEAPLGGTALVKLLNEQQDKTVAYLDRNMPTANADTLQDALIKSLKLDQNFETTKGLKAFDAEPLTYSNKIKDEYTRRVNAIHQQIKPEKEAEVVAKAMRLMLENLVVIAQSEYEAGLYGTASSLKK